jgi:tellurite methyltransferase
VDDGRENSGIDAGPDDRGRHGHAHGHGAIGEDWLSGSCYSTVLIPAQAALEHGVFDGLPLPDEIEHHHRVGEEQHQRRKEAEREVNGKVAALHGNDRGPYEPDQADCNSREQRLSQKPIISDLPSPFVMAWLDRLSMFVDRPGSALDLAMGSGRHTRQLARAGFRTFGVDAKLESVLAATARARGEALHIRAWCADLSQTLLPRERFDLVLVTRFLERRLFASIRNTLKRGGFIVYETFTVNQRRLGFGPTAPDHLLESGELAHCFEGFELLAYEEIESPEAVARIVARKTT